MTKETGTQAPGELLDTTPFEERAGTELNREEWRTLQADAGKFKAQQREGVKPAIVKPPESPVEKIMGDEGIAW